MRYLILGVTEARDETGAPLPIGGARLRALLAALALRAGGPAATVADLVDDIWGDDPPQDAPAALQALVARLRRALGGRDAVPAGPAGGYLLAVADRDEVDLHRFTRLARQGAGQLAADPATAAVTLRTALALWRGPALADLPEPARTAYAATPEAHRAAALRARIDAELRSGAADPASLLPEIEALIREHPYDEPLRAQQLRALRASGRPADALAAYEDTRRTLAEALGTNPGPELTALHTELLDPPSPTPPTTPPPPAPAAPAPPAHPATPPPPLHPGSPVPTAYPATPLATEAAAPAVRPAAPASPALAETPAYPASPAAPAVPAPPPVPALPAESAPPVRPVPPAAPASPAHPAPPAFRAAPPATAPAPRAVSVPSASADPVHPAVPMHPAFPAEPPALARPAPPAATAPPAQPGERAGNLRPRLTSFVGREPELAGLRRDMARLRLVTLTGPGGSGKTRLAEHAAADHPEPGWLVELARLDHPAAVPGAVLSALGLRESTLVARDKAPADEPAAQLVEHCANRSLLLVLDNCEHVIGAAAELAEHLLTHCPGVRILATSREPLGVPGETVRPVDPLPPDPAHRLFADRAAAVRPGFTPADDPAAVAEICARLDGLPLAIELAAARLRLLTPRQIADRLDDRFRLLTGGARTVLPRQQTLRAVVDWSWDLLDDSERTVLRRLSVFAGGCDVAAAEAVCADPDAADTPDVLDLLGSLVDKSLVVAAPAPDGMRYRLLETIREYAAERAAAHPADRRAAAHRHAAHFLALAEEAEPLLRGAAQLPWIRRIETELDNLRAALLHTVHTGAVETGQRLALALGWFWWLRNYRTEGAEWTARLLETSSAEPPEGTPAYWRFMRLRMLHVFLIADGNAPKDLRTPQSIALAERVRQIFRAGGPETARFPGMLWPMTSLLTGNSVDFRDGLDETVDNCRRHGEDWELGVSLMLRTHMGIDITGGLSTVDADLAELHEIADRVGDRWTRSQVASAAGEVALSRGRYDWARSEYEECLRLAREVGAHMETPFAIARIAESAFCSGDFAGAEQLLAEAAREAERYGGMHEIQAYGGMLTALVALVAGDLGRARTECELARAAAGKMSGPPQLAAGLGNIDAVLTGREHGPQAGLAKLAPALATAVAARCAERVLASLTDTAAVLLSASGRTAEGVRVLAAATAWRAGHPRSVPEQAAVGGLPAAARSVLGADRYTAEEAAGAKLSPAEVATLVTQATEATQATETTRVTGS
ncbi:AfsR/SARP family transcriptional regulator [Streptomyces sp. NBC_01006]|uniref:AfsR/SARP family transcriptional regulator n=1 Tax=Streptomyces sp. NBC_01006 TaxID=2903716 RepID=UPI00386BF066|nr:AfsR/SARP family transcriptional regulator [Streptomyces sp. NBC_01006]